MQASMAYIPPFIEKKLSTDKSLTLIEYIATTSSYVVFANFKNYPNEHRHEN